MLDISKLFVNLDVVLSKRTTLGQVLAPYEINNIISRAKKNNWSDEAIIEYVYRYLKENISDLVDNSDFLDANVIVESDPNITKAMQLMDQSQQDAEKLILDKEYKYPGCWVTDIANALKKLECPEYSRENLIWDAYYNANWESNADIPGWANLAETLENYYNTL